MIRRGATALVLLMVAPASLSGAGLPNANVQAAISILSERSMPTPIDGDVEVADGRFRHRGNCDELRQRYQAENAPMPPNSTVSVDAYGNLHVAAPYGPAGVLVADTNDGACDYQIAVSPTLVVETAETGRVAAFSSVLCYSLLGYPAVGGEFEQAGEPHAFNTILTDPDRNTWLIAIGPGSLDEALASQEEPGADVILGTFTGVMEDGQLIGDGTIDDGSLHIELQCTPFRPLFSASG